MLLGVVRETRLEDGVTGDLTEVTAKWLWSLYITAAKIRIVRLPGEFPDLGSNAVLLHQRFLGEVELERVVSGERHVEPPGQIVRERGTGIVEEQTVVTQWGHRDTDLSTNIV